ncbi:hypothetical protein FACS1894200_06280 [Spirochaetia bacterium]|nr:hypothetical protein FACS1894200_06280 [Spirochaetia bacterium]
MKIREVGMEIREARIYLRETPVKRYTKARYYAALGSYLRKSLRYMRGCNRYDTATDEFALFQLLVYLYGKGLKDAVAGFLEGRFYERGKSPKLIRCRNLNGFPSSAVFDTGCVPYVMYAA